MVGGDQNKAISYANFPRDAGNITLNAYVVSAGYETVSLSATTTSYSDSMTMLHLQHVTVCCPKVAIKSTDTDLLLCS